MFRLVFSTIWTGLPLAVLLSDTGLQDWERAVLVLFVGVGLLFIWLNWRSLRRLRSLRTEREGDVTVYVWTELDGTERRSTRDPREDWARQDADDSDGDGGD